MKLQVLKKWYQCHGPWVFRYTCHCGYYKDEYFNLCPECGCEGDITFRKGRMEWESNYRLDMCPEIGASRDLHWVPFTKCSEVANAIYQKVAKAIDASLDNSQDG
jgi:hypothetical protein